MIADGKRNRFPLLTSLYRWSYPNRVRAHVVTLKIMLAWMSFCVYSSIICSCYTTGGIRTASREAEIGYQRGMWHVSMGELDQAIIEFSKAIEVDDRFGEAYSNRGVAHLNKGELDQAISDFT